MKSEDHVVRSEGKWTVAHLGELYQNIGPQLLSRAARTLGSETRAEEVVQDSLIRMLLAAPELNSESHAIGYLHKTVENLCLDLLRLEGRRPRLVLIDDAVSELDSKWNTPDFSELISALDDAAIVRQAIARLSHAERAAIVMWEMEGRSTREIARELGIKESSVRHTVRRARSSLRRVLSELVIDEKRGLTALDLLSTTYRRSRDITKKSSKAALALVMLCVTFIGFDHVSNKSLPFIEENVKENSQSPNVVQGFARHQSTSVTVEKENQGSRTSKVAPRTNAKSQRLWFEGLDKFGVPTDFTVTDSSGSLGSLFVSSKDPVLTETELRLSWLVKTRSFAANVFLNQTLIQDNSELKYEATVSYGREGFWIPLVSEVISTESVRLLNGNYLITAIVQVQSEVDTPISIPATAGGRDLPAAPSRVITCLVLSPNKAQILAQAVQVIERGVK